MSSISISQTDKKKKRETLIFTRSSSPAAAAVFKKVPRPLDKTRIFFAGMALQIFPVKTNFFSRILKNGLFSENLCYICKSVWYGASLCSLFFPLRTCRRQVARHVHSSSSSSFPPVRKRHIFLVFFPDWERQVLLAPIFKIQKFIFILTHT